MNDQAPPPTNQHPARPHMRLRDRLFHRPRLLGLIGAIVFFWESLNPTLLPRTWAVQALLCGCCTAIGYALGASASVLLGWFRDRINKPALRSARLRVAAWLSAGVVLIAGGIWWSIWQNDQRTLVQMPHISRTQYVPAVLVGAVLCLILILAGRLVGQGLVAIHRWLSRLMPKEIAFAATVAVFVFVGVLIGQDAIFNQFVNWANSAYGAGDNTTPDGITQPTSNLVTGGPESLVAWSTLGKEGRNFTGGVLTPSQLQTLAKPGAPIMQPIRVYVGLQSASSAEARAQLAVQELERTGAFKRRVLVVATTTGTGWVNPKSARTVEAMNGGNTAIVATQYSYLPSWISFLVDTEKAADAGRTLYNAVHAKWASLPADQRPLFIVFGESLGSYGSESAFVQTTPSASVQNIASNTHGALWIGPTYSNPIRTPLIEERNGNTPTWRPVIGNGQTVTFTNTPQELTTVQNVPVVYEQHPSDPVGWWNMQTMWNVPLWLQGPRGYDVPQRASWFPIVTWGQVSADLIAGFSAPSGHGHNYDNAWPQAWATLAAPPGWTPADSDALSTRLGAFVSPSK